jgi:hypothetical protein
MFEILVKVGKKGERGMVVEFLKGWFRKHSGLKSILLLG